MTGVNSNENDPESRLDEALADFMKRKDSGEKIDRERFLKDHSEIADLLRELLDAADCIEHMAGPTIAEWQRQYEVESQASPSDPNQSTSDIPIQQLGPIGINDATLPHSTTNRSSDFSMAGMPTADSTQPNLPCRFGEYTLEKILGRGGMGVVYLAKQVQLDRAVAIKMIRSGCLASEDEITRFYAEARSAAKLDHPNIVTVYQCGEHEGHHFFSMDFVPGTDLARRMAEGSMAPRDAARYVRDVALAISYAHQRGILHRDLKPANVLINEHDHVVVTDFGLAKLMGSQTGLTATGAALGTPSYMSPEQAAGKNDEHNVATDIYSMGAILFALLVGKPPFAGDTVIQTIMQVMHKPTPQIRQLRREVHSDLETIVNKCLQKQPQRRYASAMELANDLDRFLKGEPIQARPLTRLQKGLYWLQGIPLVAALTGFRSLDPTPSHRWAQRSILAALLMLPVGYFGGIAAINWWHENRMPSRVQIASGSPGGMYQTFAGHLAQRFEDRIGGHPSVLSTEGSDDNLNRLLTGKADLALLQASSVRGANVAVVAPLYYEALHLLVRQDLQIDSLSDLKGKRIAVGASRSGTREAVNLILNFFQLDEKQFEVLPADQSNLQDVMDVDAAFIMIKPGVQSVSDLIGSGRFRMISIPKSLEISRDEPTFRAIEILPADYPLLTIDKPIATVATTAFLATRTDTPRRLVRAALESMYESDSPIPGILSVDRAAHWQGLPWHPAAREFFDRRKANRN